MVGSSDKISLFADHLPQKLTSMEDPDLTQIQRRTVKNLSNPHLSVSKFPRVRPALALIIIVVNYPTMTISGQTCLPLLTITTTFEHAASLPATFAKTRLFNHLQQPNSPSVPGLSASLEVCQGADYSSIDASQRLTVTANSNPM